MIKVLVFGTFDGLHEGHRTFFRLARNHGEQLIAVVAHDEIVELLKKHPPRKLLEQRINDLLNEDLVDIVTAGDLELSTYHVVRRYRPEVIALGYDQEQLKWDIESSLHNVDWDMQIVVIEAHEPEKYHSSIIAESESE